MARSSLIPGFRFHPTDVELVMFYLKRKLLGKKITVKAVAEVNIYDFSPWDLPDKSSLKSGDLEWYFFCRKAKKYSSGCRSSRSTETGFWKATGKDRQVSYNGRTVATIKTLVFHLGHAGKGQRTNWVMHEYKMEDPQLADAGIVQDMYVLCKVFEKSGSGPKNGAHYGKPFNEEEWGDDLATSFDSNVIGGLVGASDTMGHQQKGLAILKMTEPGSSTVTSSSNQFTNILDDKQKGPAATNMAEPGSSTLTFSADQPTTTFNEESGADIGGCINSQMVVGLVGASNTSDNEQKGLATVNMTEPQTAHGDVMFLEDIDLPGADAVLSFNDVDVLFCSDVDVIMRSEEAEAANMERVKSSMVPTKDDNTFDGLVNLIELDDLNEIDFKTDTDAYTLDKLLPFDDLDVSLGEFYVD